MKLFLIGIDPGAVTGLSVWDGKNLIRVDSMPIHEAMDKVAGFDDLNVMVRIEHDPAICRFK